jgi:hypothetical protein
MSQSTIIAGSLVAAFLVYVIGKGELPQYLAVFRRNTNSNLSNTSAITTPNVNAQGLTLPGSTANAFGFGQVNTNNQGVNVANSLINEYLLGN